MTKPRIAVFCDFDGTISSRDIGYSLFHHFSGGQNDALLPDWKSGRMTTRDCLVKEAELVTVSEREAHDFLEQFELTDGFADFVKRCRSHDIPFSIVSDGLDFYIHYLLERTGWTDLPVVCNHGAFAGSRLTVSFPRDNIACKRCGICKGEVLDEFRQEHGADTVMVFIGDGYSDACAAHKADILFAKKDLAEYCRDNDISFTNWDSFHDIVRSLNERQLLPNG